MIPTIAAKVADTIEQKTRDHVNLSISYKVDREVTEALFPERIQAPTALTDFTYMCLNECVGNL